MSIYLIRLFFIVLITRLVVGPERFYHVIKYPLKNIPAISGAILGILIGQLCAIWLIHHGL